MTGAGGLGDKRMLLWLMTGAVALIALFSALAPQPRDEDPRPRTVNNGKAGVKAAAMSLAQLGYKVQVLTEPADALAHLDAPRTTLLLLGPRVRESTRATMAAAVEAFVRRGGRVLAAGAGSERLLPNGHTTVTSTMQGGLCLTTPQGRGPLARAGELSILNYGPWDVAESKLGPALVVEQRCGNDAVVVRYAVGAGEVVWWSWPLPISNQGLRDDASLKLTLASLGAPGRTVVFDEYMLGTEPSPSPLAGLPIGWIEAQLALVAALLVFSFSRRNRPLRMPVTVPRSTPVEFAESMGHLYARAGAVGAPVEMARRGLLRVLSSEAGVDRATLEAGPAAVREVLTARLGGDWSLLESHLVEAAAAERGQWTPQSALWLVQALYDDRQRFREAVAPAFPASKTAAPDAARENEAVLEAAVEGATQA